MTFRSWLQRMEKRTHDRGRLLDIGCAVGHFLQLAKADGWAPYGLEISDFASGIARERIGGTIATGTVETCDFSDGFFDAVTAFDVIEHVEKPRIFLSRISKLLKRGGLFAFSTLDIDSCSSRLMGRHWPHIKTEHMCCFSRRLIRRWLPEYGFQIDKIQSARKYLCLSFVADHFEKYKVPLLTPIILVASHAAPITIRTLAIPIPTGEIFVIARKI
jgi:2-polyprenyl-3-methyl-5-hydroxy-6-metoxy-1,4-benzoquinol methylase